MFLTPAVDGDFVPDEPLNLFHKAAEIDYLAGVNNTDGFSFTASDIPSLQNNTEETPACVWFFSRGSWQLSPKTRDQKVSSLPLLNTFQTGGPRRARRPFRGAQWTLGHMLPSTCILPTLCKTSQCQDWFFILLWAVVVLLRCLDYYHDEEVLSSSSDLLFTFFQKYGRCFQPPSILKIEMFIQ